jgi:putative transposase
MSLLFIWSIIMSRPQRLLEPNLCHHITVRCNNREFNLIRQECRDLMLNAIYQAKAKSPFHLYALCIMSNHVHYLIKPDDPAQLPRIMHYINWYSAMCFNRLLKRTGHFWEGRYRSASFPEHEQQRALNTLRYIHANPKTAGMRKSYFYAYSNYGIYHRLTDDGLTEWHPAFLSMGQNLDACQQRYQRFCQRYSPKKKPGGFAPGEAACSRTACPKTPAGVSPVKTTCSKTGAK